MSATYLTECSECGRTTSRAYAKKHQGRCRSCSEPEKLRHPIRNERMLESGWLAYAREEGHYDLPDNY